MPFPSPNLLPEFSELSFHQALLGSMTTFLVNYCLYKANSFKQRNSALSQPKGPSDEEDSQPSQPIMVVCIVSPSFSFEHFPTNISDIGDINLAFQSSDELALPHFLSFINNSMTDQGAPYLFASNDEMEHL